MSSGSNRSLLHRAWEVVSDLLVATALIWALPLLFGAAVATLTLLADRF